jgi:hypothetical protein
MICGWFGIMYVGGVYCPLNPTDPLVVGGTLVLLRTNGHLDMPYFILLKLWCVNR